MFPPRSRMLPPLTLTMPVPVTPPLIRLVSITVRELSLKISLPAVIALFPQKMALFSRGCEIPPNLMELKIAPPKSALEAEIEAIDPDALTPLQALNALYELRAKLKER